MPAKKIDAVFGPRTQLPQSRRRLIGKPHKAYVERTLEAMKAAGVDIGQVQIVVQAGEGRVTITPSKPTPMPDGTNA